MANAPAPPAAPTPPAPPVGVKPPAAAPAPTIRLNTGGPSATKPMARPAAPAPTIKLATSTKPIGAATQQGLPAPASTAALPKATVNLAPPTQPLGTTASATGSKAPTLMVANEEEMSTNDKLTIGLSVLGFVAACALLAFQLMLAGVWINAEDNPNESGWIQQLLE